MTIAKFKDSIFFLVLIFSFTTHAQGDLLKTKWDQYIIGKWTNRVNLNSEGAVYLGIKCKDTIQYFPDGTYEYKGCEWNAIGKWKFSNNKTYIIHYEIDSKYWKKLLETEDLGEMHTPIISLTDAELITTFLTEDQGEIKSYYIKLE